MSTNDNLSDSLSTECPTCETRVGAFRDACPSCGQAIDWAGGDR
jgi:endogenous inhibitor of DNA gyrase (YacG/DUF329 family)